MRCVLLLGLLAAALTPISVAFAQTASNAVPTLPGGPTATPPAPQSASASALAQPDVAFADYQRGFYATALHEAMRRLAANPRDAAAMTLVGQIYLDGFAVKLDHAEADRWFALASNLNNPQASFLLGRAYLEGDGVTKDLDRARELFRKAAAQNNAGALYNLGVMAIQYDRNFVAAASYFQRAAAAGDTESLYALAVLYRSGSGVSQDNAKAAQLMQQAADEHDVDAEVEYGIALFNGDGVPKNEGLAAKYFFLAAAGDNPVAEDRIARMLAAGRGVSQNMVEAMKWWVLARAAGLKDAWLDQKLASLSQQERVALREALRQYAGD
jgi:uncharacterized protein